MKRLRNMRTLKSEAEELHFLPVQVFSEPRGLIFLGEISSTVSEFLQAWSLFSVRVAALNFLNSERCSAGFFYNFCILPVHAEEFWRINPLPAPGSRNSRSEKCLTQTK